LFLIICPPPRFFALVAFRRFRAAFPGKHRHQSWLSQTGAPR
jgi:hypothetical protein